MLSYRHGFHAGNHGDVLKHAVLALLLEALTGKPTPLAYLETHAGIGRYRLDSETAQKTGEYAQGIGRLWDADDVPAVARPYLDAVHALNPDGVLHSYPGSPEVARSLLRDTDRMLLAELHTNDYPLLKATYRYDRRVAVHHMDGYRALKGFLPPRENRGLVLIDPSYEVKGEYGQAADALVAAQRRWRNGVFALWYPVVERATVAGLEQRLRAAGLPKFTGAELCIADDGAPGMSGSGLFIVNTPWRLDERLRELLPWLHARLAPSGAGGWRLDGPTE
jgi:23S rRNA (adenine2030-N6)-methyltransferase